MTSYSFNGNLYRNSREMHVAIAEECILVDGNNSREDLQEILAAYTDNELTDEAIKGWALGELDDEGLPWPREFDRVELLAAFAHIREHFDEHFSAYQSD